MCATGEHIPTVTFQVQGSGRTKTQYLQIKMEDVLVSSIKPGGSSSSGSELPIEEVSFNYAKIYVTYVPQTVAGTPDQAVTVSWDLKAAKSV